MICFVPHRHNIDAERALLLNRLTTPATPLRAPNNAMLVINPSLHRPAAPVTTTGAPSVPALSAAAPLGSVHTVSAMATIPPRHTACPILAVPTAPARLSSPPMTTPPLASPAQWADSTPPSRNVTCVMTKKKTTS